MNNEFNKGLFLAGFGSFWWGFFGVLYFKYITFIGHVELVVHRCLWTTFTHYSKILDIILIKISGGRTEIRTQERVAPLPVFKTGAFNHSAILP